LTALALKPSSGNSLAVVVVLRVRPVAVQMEDELGAVIRFTPPEELPTVWVITLDRLAIYQFLVIGVRGVT